MIVFFDILILDDDICLRKPHRRRRLLLKDVVKKIHGRADLAEQEILDFGHLDSRNRLEVSFARAIAQRWEGYVLKACDEPYFPIYAAGTNASFARWIKLKKDYIQGLGDTVDLALVGAYYDSGDAAALPSLKGLTWTHFLVGCLMNKAAVLKSEEAPRFRIVDALNRHCMHRDYLKCLNQYGEFSACDPNEFRSFTVEYGRQDLSKACVLFKKPFVVEMMGSGFEKPSGARYYALRFPRILKIYTDRTFEDAASFQELQVLADDARSVPTECLSDEVGQWHKRLRVGNGINHYINRRTHSPSSTCSSDPDSEMDLELTDSRATSHDSEEDGKSHIPQIHLQTSRKSNYTHGCGGMLEVPAVHLDETDSNPSPTSPCNRNILAENENLSYCQSSIQRKHGDVHGLQEKNTTFASYRLQKKAAVGVPYSPLESRRASLLREQDTRPSGVLDDFRSPCTPNNAPQSPLTTIPVYMSGKPSAGHDAKTSSHSGLHEFIQTLSSRKSIFALEKSNPQAAHQRISYGIFLVNPGENPLGKEIRRTANALSETFRRDRSRVPIKCRIFFLDSVILEQNIQPEDPKFCARETWSDLGRQYYYACLRWGLHEESENATMADSVSCTMNQHLDNPNEPFLPALSVGFNENEILALGEFTSTELVIR